MKTLKTKQRILYEALKLFSENGYEAVHVAQIADAVGIKAPSLYKHFKSKQDIFSSLLFEMEQRYASQMNSLQMNGIKPDKDAEFLMSINEEQLIEIGKNLFEFYLHDEYAGIFRRMLILEQYHSSKLADLYAKQYIEDPLFFQGTIFGMLSQAGELMTENFQVMALHFYAPIFLFITLCDCHPEKEQEALILIELHIKQFNRLYKKGRNNE